jgi:hypothetical protein
VRGEDRGRVEATGEARNLSGRELVDRGARADQVPSLVVGDGRREVAVEPGEAENIRACRDDVAVVVLDDQDALGASARRGRAHAADVPMCADVEVLAHEVADWCHDVRVVPGDPAVIDRVVGDEHRRVEVPGNPEAVAVAISVPGHSRVVVRHEAAP